MIVVGQLLMVVLALALAYAPQYYMFIIILYFVGIFGFSMYKSRRAGSRISREEIESARILFKEDKALDLAVGDEDYVRMLSKQWKTLIFSFLLFPVYIIIFNFARNAQSAFNEFLAGLGLTSEKLAAFILWVIVFEFFFVMNHGIRRILMGGKGFSVPLVPPAYRVTEKGIVTKGGFGPTIGFPLPEGSTVELNSERNYVEIRLPKGAVIRLYSKRASRLYEIIQRYGLRKSSKS